MPKTAALLAVLGASLLGARASFFEVRQAAADCSELQLIIARGTDELPNPTYGLVVGDPLFAATQKLIPGVTGYAVNYPASTACDSRDLGSQDTVKHLASASQACPQQKYALVGYSQGADVMHFAAPNISTSLYPRIIALVMFGDPANKGPNITAEQGGIIPAFPDALAQKLKQNCANGDPVCSNGTNINGHLAYNDRNVTYIPDSAAYIQKQLQTDGKAGPDPSPNGGVGGAANAAALSRLGSLLGAPTCPASTSSATSISAVSTTSSGTKPNSSATNTGSATSTTSTGAASRLKPFNIFQQAWLLIIINVAPAP